MRIAVGAIMHESNTFATLKTKLEDFNPLQKLQLDNHPIWHRSSAAGIIHSLESAGAELVPTLFGRALVGGTVERSAYEYMSNQLVQAVENAGRIDGICLALHGSMMAEGTDDPEGELLSRLRRVVGDDIPIVCALDMHAKMTSRALRAANAFTAYRTAPHTDQFETGIRAVRLLELSLKEGVRLRTAAVTLPMLLSGEQSETAVSPMRELIRNAIQTSDHPDAVSADYLLGFPWADTPHHGINAIVVGRENNLEQLEQLCREMASAFWERRHEFAYTTEAYPLDEALRIAEQETSRPIILSDTGDNPTAGASEDLTLVLKRLLELGWQETLVAVIADQASWQACAEAGMGERVRLQLGRLDPASADSPLEVEVEVLLVQTVKGIPSCVVVIKGIHIVITASRTAVYDPSFLTELALEPTAFKLIVVKSGYLSPEYQRLAAKRIFALTPGDTNINISSITYHIVPRPIYPLDRDMEWRP